MSAGLEAQKAIFDILSASVPISAAVSGVFDDVAVNYDLFPYITIGEDVLTEWDLDAEGGFSASVTIHTWSRVKGQVETKTIQGLIYTALHRVALTLTTYDCILCRQTEQISSKDPDGLTRHGVQTFALLLREI